MPTTTIPLPHPTDVLLVAFHPAVEGYRDALEEVRYLRGRVEARRAYAERVVTMYRSRAGRVVRDRACTAYEHELAKLPHAEARLWALAAQVRQLPDGEAELVRVRESASRAAALRAEALHSDAASEALGRS